MWFYLEQEEFEVIEEMLDKTGLHGLKLLMNEQFNQISPVNPLHTTENAIKAAKSYFSASDLSFENYVRWDANGDAKVLSLQNVPKEYINEADCNCGK